MSYATVSDFENRIGTLFGNVYSGADGAAAAQADLESAAAEVDGALAFRYALPVGGERSLTLLKDWTLTLGEERACARTAGSVFAEKVKTRAAQVRTYLEMVRTDRFRLPDAKERTSSDVRLTLTKGEPPVFGRDHMEGF